ncbi:hypothetical protein NC652_031405 [Populus alba x Populus x berolinensis]|nr:hypothetical protein NC652_031405 [Populus alba x Populus x berolinensis]
MRKWPVKSRCLNLKLGNLKREKGDKGKSSKRGAIICYECKKPSHVQRDCIIVKNKVKFDTKEAMKATTWDNMDDNSTYSGTKKKSIVLKLVTNLKRCI